MREGRTDGRPHHLKTCIVPLFAFQFIKGVLPRSFANIVESLAEEVHGVLQIQKLVLHGAAHALEVLDYLRPSVALNAFL